jgi:hypothetical protein
MPEASGKTGNFSSFGLAYVQTGMLIIYFNIENLILWARILY